MHLSAASWRRREPIRCPAGFACRCLAGLCHPLSLWHVHTAVPVCLPRVGRPRDRQSAGGPTLDGTTNVWPSGNVTIVAHQGEIGGPVVGPVVVDHSGRFSINLPSGIYTLVQADVAGQPKTVTIRPGEYAHVILWQAVP